MIEIKLVELNRGRDYIRYEIIKNGSRFITGWIRFRDIKELKYKYEGKKDTMVLFIITIFYILILNFHLKMRQILK